MTASAHVLDSNNLSDKLQRLEKRLHVIRSEREEELQHDFYGPRQVVESWKQAVTYLRSGEAEKNLAKLLELRVQWDELQRASKGSFIRIVRKKRAKKRQAQIEQEVRDFVRQLKEFDAGNGYVAGTRLYNNLLDCEGFRPLLLEDRENPANRAEIEQGMRIAVEDCLKYCSDVLREEINTLEDYVHHRDVESFAEERKLLQQIEKLKGETA